MAGTAELLEVLAQVAMMISANRFNRDDVRTRCFDYELFPAQREKWFRNNNNTQFYQKRNIKAEITECIVYG